MFVKFVVGWLIFAQVALAGPPQVRPEPFLPRVVTARIVSPVVTVLLVSIVVAPANPLRKAFMIWNNSANSGYCCMAATCTSASPTRIIATFTTWEPQQLLVYQGAISCIRNAGTGGMAVWELEG